MLHRDILFCVSGYGQIDIFPQHIKYVSLKYVAKLKSGKFATLVRLLNIYINDPNSRMRIYSKLKIHIMLETTHLFVCVDNLFFQG